MHRLTLSYRWQHDADASDGLVRPALSNPLLDLLQAVHDHGSISGAARALGLSYRHVWGELKRWETELQQQLVHWEKGQAARLSPFASKLLWAERQAQARLGPQIEALHSELQRSFAAAFDPSAQLLSLYASHDEGLSRLRQWTGAHHNLHLDIQFMGSVDAVLALQQGRTALAGFHFFRPETSHCLHGVSPSWAALGEMTFKQLLNAERHCLIGFATRSQGLMVAPGNPLSIGSLRDAIQKDVKFALRGPGTGTALLLRQLLGLQGLTAPAHWDQQDTEPSHAAVAQAIVGAYAHVGLGIEAAALARGLDFIALAKEHYFLVCERSMAGSVAVQSLCTALQSVSWQQEMGRMAGYCPFESGRILDLRAILPE